MADATDVTEQADLTPAEPKLGYGPVAAVLVGVGSFFAAQFGAVLLLVAALGLAGWEPDRINDWVRSSNFATFSISMAVAALTLLLLASFLRHRRTSLSAIGLVRPRLNDVGYGIGGWFLYFAAMILVVHLVKSTVPGLDLEQQQELGYSRNVVGPALLVAFAGLVLLPPLAEEILFRGFLYTGLRSKLPVMAAAIITSVLFGVAHLEWGSDNPLHWAAALDTLILSFVLIYLRHTQRSLWPAIFLHMFKNGYAFLVLFVFKIA